MQVEKIGDYDRYVAILKAGGAVKRISKGLTI